MVCLHLLADECTKEGLALTTVATGGGGGGARITFCTSESNGDAEALATSLAIARIAVGRGGNGAGVTTCCPRLSTPRGKMAAKPVPGGLC